MEAITGLQKPYWENIAYSLVINLLNWQELTSNASAVQGFTKYYTQIIILFSDITEISTYSTDVGSKKPCIYLKTVHSNSAVLAKSRVAGRNLHEVPWVACLTHGENRVRDIWPFHSHNPKSEWPIGFKQLSMMTEQDSY